MIIGLGIMTKDAAKALQGTYIHHRDRYPERHPKHLSSTIRIKKAGGISKSMVHVSLVLHKLKMIKKYKVVFQE